MGEFDSPIQNMGLHVLMPNLCYHSYWMIEILPIYKDFMDEK